jgi:transcription-repair coupling factor (superfamily II helicase)
MIEFENIKNESFIKFKQNLGLNWSFSVTGLTTVLRLFLIKQIAEITKKKVLFITSSEQNALKYKNDLEKGFDVTSEIMPFQNVSMYENINMNFYDYAEQIRVLNSAPNIVISPVKSLLEKFPTKDFLNKYKINLKVGEEINTKQFAQQLVNIGYKRVSMVSDISEFSIRGDIIDIFSLSEHPVRIELWGDEIVDIRYFNNETQKSIEKIKNTEILPVYKFVLPETKNEDELTDYSEVQVYQNNYNDDLVSILDYFKDYIISF